MVDHTLIQKYTSKWIEQFQVIKQEIEQVLTEINIKIEHIGSTSVPGLDAKAIIDIDVAYPPDADFEEIKLRLATIGYYHNGDQGIVNREAFKRRGLPPKNKVLDTIVHHLYVCPGYSEELHRHLLFRDYLRMNDVARMEYQELKYQLAKEADQDKKIYAQIKEIKAKDFINSMIEKAKNTKQ